MNVGKLYSSLLFQCFTAVKITLDGCHELGGFTIIDWDLVVIWMVDYLIENSSSQNYSHSKVGENYYACILHLFRFDRSMFNVFKNYCHSTDTHKINLLSDRVCYFDVIYLTNQPDPGFEHGPYRIRCEYYSCTPCGFDLIYR